MLVTMKKVIIYTLMAGALLAISNGCTRMQNPIFDKAATVRVDDKILEIRKQLIEEPHGWILEMATGSQQQYGTYQVALKFADNGEVLARSETPYDFTDWHKSNYLVATDKSISINFNTFNEAIHRFSTPDREEAGGLSKGYEGEYEYEIVDFSKADQLLLKGKRFGRITKMYRAVQSLDTHFEALAELKSKVYSYQGMGEQRQDALVGNQGGKTHLLRPHRDGFNVFTLETEGVDGLRTLSYAFTDKGIELSSPIEGVSSFVWDTTKGYYVGSDGSTLIARKDPLYIKYAAYLGEYTLQLRDASFDIRFEEHGYNEYVIKGAPVDIIATYVPVRDGFSIKAQSTTHNGEKIRIAMYDAKAGYLTTNTKYGVYSSPIPNTNPQEYEIIDDGTWGKYVANAFLLRHGTKSANYTKVTPYRWLDIKFIKKP